RPFMVKDIQAALQQESRGELIQDSSGTRWFRRGRVQSRLDVLDHEGTKRRDACRATSKLDQTVELDVRGIIEREAGEWMLCCSRPRQAGEEHRKHSRQQAGTHYGCSRNPGDAGTGFG